MALFRLSTISINNSFGIYTAGDVIICNYNDQTESVEVYLNGSIIISGSTLVRSNVTDLSWSVLTTGYSTTTEESGVTYLNNFPFTASFPYHNTSKTELDIDQDGEVRDISIRFISMIMPESGASDGEITIEANGTNSPFKYYTTDPREFVNNSDFSTGQDTGEFTGLVGGATYTLYAAGYGADNPRLDVESITIELPINDVPNISTYKTRWELEYDNLTDSTYKTEILERGYTLEPEVVVGTGNPYGHSMRGDGQDVYNLNILSSNVNVNFLATTVDQFKDIAVSDEKKYIVRRSKLINSVYQTQWTGFVTPSSYSDVLYNPPYAVSISANDRLGDLKGLKFLFGANDSGNFAKGNISQLSIIHICLQKLSMGFGYRIACNIFAENHTTIDDTPLAQTLVNVDTYLNDDGTDVAFCDEVIKDILEIYGATLFSWEGYWYVVRQEEWLNETINYVQYNSDIEFEESNSWNPRIDLKRSFDTERAVFKGGAQNRIFTQLYGKVNLTQKLDLLDIEGNLLPSLSKDNVTLGNGISNPKFKGFDLINNGSDISSNSVKDSSGWSLGLRAELGSKSFVETTGTVSYSEVDQLELELGLNVSATAVLRLDLGNYPQYAQLKWSLKLGSNWVGRSGTLSSTEIINIEFIESFNSDTTITRVLDMSQSSESGGDDYILRVYPVDLEESDLYVDTSGNYDPVITEVKTVTTQDISVGARLSIMYDNYILGTLASRSINFYELTRGEADEILGVKIDTIDRIAPSDQSAEFMLKRVWLLRSTYDVALPGDEIIIDGRPAIVSWLETITVFNDIKLSYKRDSENEIEDEFVSNSIGESKNNIELDYEVNQFDIPDISNGQKLIRNFLKYEDLTPTSNWTKTGGTVTKSIQSHLLDWLTILSKRCRAKVSGEFRTDGVDLAPINVLHAPTDNNRLYLPTGVNSNFKLQEYSGQLLEVGSGDDVSTSAYTTGFKQDAFR
jgi:hypothetical protein